MPSLPYFTAQCDRGDRPSRRLHPDTTASSSRCEWHLRAASYRSACWCAHYCLTHSQRTAQPEMKGVQPIKPTPSSPPTSSIKNHSTPPRPGLRPGTRYDSIRRLIALSPTNSVSPPSSPPSFVIDGPSTSVDAFDPSSSRNLTVPAKKRRRSSTTSSVASAAAQAQRERSQSASSWYSYTSVQTADEVSADYEALADGETKTILDPAFHFPAPQGGLLGVPNTAEGQSITMLRRKRSWSGSRPPHVGYGLP